MGLSKRPKGKEIEEWVTRGWKYHKESERRHHPELVAAISELRRDVNLLMAHLKLEFKDIPEEPKKRIVTKATKKPKKTEEYKYNITNSAYMGNMTVQPTYWGAGTCFPQLIIKK